MSNSKEQLEEQRFRGAIRQELYLGVKDTKVARKFAAGLHYVQQQKAVLEENGIEQKAPWLSTAQASVLLGLTPDAKRVGQLVRQKRLKYERIGHVYAIPGGEVLRFAKLKRNAGAKKKA